MSLDLRDKENPLEICACGSMLWKVLCQFENSTISLYMLEMECYACGSLATAPTPLDAPGYIWKKESDEYEQNE